MIRERSTAHPITPPLGPGDADPRFRGGGEAGPVRPPLGPGDDEGEPVARGAAAPIRGPLSPGEQSDGRADVTTDEEE